MLRILLDVDDVLADFTGGLLTALGVPNPWRDSRNWGVRDLNTLLGLPSAELWAPCDKHEFWENLRWCGDGRQILAVAESAAGKENVFLITSPTLGVEAYSGKAAWVKRELPDYYRRLMVGPCKFLCAKPNQILVDDSGDNCREYWRNGGHAVLVPRLTNSWHGAVGFAVEMVESKLREIVQ